MALGKKLTEPRTLQKRRAFLAVALLTTCVAVADAQTPQDPEALAVVKALFTLDRSGRGDEIFSEKSSALRAYFSPAFAAAWKSAKARDGDPPALEGDPLTGQQESNGERPVRFALEGVDTVVVTLSASTAQPRGAVEYAVKFKFVDVAGHRVIDDIQYPAALASLSEIANPKIAAQLRAYIGSYRKTLDHVIVDAGARP